MEIPKEELGSALISWWQQVSRACSTASAVCVAAPSGAVLHSLLSLLGVRVKCGWALWNLYFSAPFTFLLPGRYTGYGDIEKTDIMIPVESQDQVVCNKAGHASALLLYILQACRLREASRAMHILAPLLLVCLRFFLAQDRRRKHLYELSNALSWRNRAGKYWNGRCAASILLIPGSFKLEPSQFEICWR